MASQVAVSRSECLNTEIYLEPSGYYSGVGPYSVPNGYNRIMVTELTQEQIQEAAKVADTFGRSVIIQDLLMAGKPGFPLLAAELYVKSSAALRQDFLMHVVGVKPLLNLFSNAMWANCILHEDKEQTRQGSSGLTSDELRRERSLVEALQKYRA
jgi:hypothetical protein